MTKNLAEPECFALLANGRRRIALWVLRDIWNGKSKDHTRKLNRPLSIQELAERVADDVYENPSTDEIQEIRLTLYHMHLPYLEEADVISYNRDGKTIEPRPNFDTLLQFLEKIDEEK